MSQRFTIHSLGANAVTVSFGDSIDQDVNRLVVGVSEQLNISSPSWLVESFPAYSSLTLFFDPNEIKGTAEQVTSGEVFRAIERVSTNNQSQVSTHEIPVSFNENDAIDIKEVAQFAGCSADEVIELFLDREYRVYMLGFLPGFPYMASVDEQIAIPRKNSPRNLVPAGSVGIAGSQTGIYPFDSPGGWQIIGRTYVKVFDPQKESPAMFSPGDKVRFVAE